MEYLVISSVVTFIVTIVAILSIRPLAIRIGLVDRPAGRKKHTGNIPLIGGLCLLFGLAFGLLTLNISLASYRYLLVGTGLLVLTGILDDFHELRARKKLLAQFIVALIVVVLGKSSINHLGDLLFLGQVSLGYLSYPLTIIGVVGIINAINLIDGLDGLSGSLLLTMFLFLGFIAKHLGLLSDFRIIVLIMSAIFAVLVFNFPYKHKIKNKVFMGDVGSMVLGLLLSWFLIHIAKSAKSDHVPISLLWVVALPLYDMTNVTILRILKGKKPSEAGGEHIHYILKNLLKSDVKTVCILLALSIIFGSIGFSSYWFQWVEAWVFLGFLGGFLVYFTLLQKLIRCQTPAATGAIESV